MGDVKWFVLMPKGYKEVWTDDSNRREVSYSTSRVTDLFLALDVRGEKPVPADGQRVVRHLVVDGDVVRKDYLLVPEDEPLPEWVHSPRRWSRLSVKRALAAEGKWEEARSILRQADAYDDFLMCDYIEEGDETYLRMYPALAELVGEDCLVSVLSSLPTV